MLILFYKEVHKIRLFVESEKPPLSRVKHHQSFAVPNYQKPDGRLNSRRLRLAISARGIFCAPAANKRPISPPLLPDFFLARDRPFCPLLFADGKLVPVALSENCTCFKLAKKQRVYIFSVRLEYNYLLCTEKKIWLH